MFFIASKVGSIEAARKIESEIIEQKQKLSKRAKSLVNHLKNNIHPEFSLIRMLKKGIAFHNAYLDDFTKRQIEYILGEDNGINLLITTNTIAKGVNLSAKNLFVFIKKNLEADLPEIEFNNILGRAARLNINSQGHLYFVKMKVGAKKYLDIFTLQEPVTIEIKDIDPKSNKNLSKIEEHLKKPEIKNLLKDIDFFDSPLIKDLRMYINEKSIIDIETIKEENIDTMDFLIGIDNIADIESKIEKLGKINALNLIKVWDSIEKLEKLISFISDVYNWEVNIKAKYKNRMKYHNFLATILYDVSHDKSIKDIIDYNILGHAQGLRILFVNVTEQTISNKQDLPNSKFIELDTKNPEHMDLLIINTLQDVQQIIEFELKRFIQDFYYRVAKIFDITSDQEMENFLEYTTINPLKIKLIYAGITDTFALNNLIKEPYINYVEKEVINLKKLLEMVLKTEGDDSPLCYAIEDRI